MEVIAFAVIIGVGVLLFGGIGAMKPETAAQRKRRLYREAADEDRQMHKITQDVYRRMNKKHKRAKYKPSKASIQRRMKERDNDWRL